MSTITESQTAETQRLVLHDVPWEQYERLLDAFGERHLRHTYFRGMLEIVSPSRDHERIKTLLGDFVSTLCRVLQLPRQGAGSTTMHNPAWKGGLEPDEAFYIGEKSLKRLGEEETAPPDLIVEVDLSSSSQSRLELYAGMKAGEIWRYYREEVSILRLKKSGEYGAVRRSKLFSFVAPQDLTRFVELRSEQDDTALEAMFETWVRKQVKAQ